MIEGIRINGLVDGIALAESCGLKFNPLSDCCIGKTDKIGVLQGGVLFTDYTGPGGSVWMHAAIYNPRAAVRDMWWVSFDYPFNQMRVKKIFAPVSTENEHAYQLDLRMGFKLEAVIKDVYPEGDMRLLSMYPGDCRFLSWTPRNIKRGQGNG